MKALLIRVDFADESDFDAFRHRFVSECEGVAEDLSDDAEAPYADGAIEVSWDVDEDGLA